MMKYRTKMIRFRKMGGMGGLGEIKKKSLRSSKRTFKIFYFKSSHPPHPPILYYFLFFSLTYKINIPFFSLK